MLAFSEIQQGIVPLEEHAFLEVDESKRGEPTLISLTPTPVRYRDGGWRYEKIQVDINQRYHILPTEQD